MPSAQDWLLNQIAHQPGTTGLVIFAVGVIYGFHGFRLFTPLLGLTWAGLGALVGLILSSTLALPPIPTVAGVALVCAVAAFNAHRGAAVGACAAVWGLLGWYLAEQLGGELMVRIVCAGSAGLLGGLFAFLCYRTMTVLLTTMQGAVLMVIGMIGVSNAYLPTFGTTFLTMADRIGVLGPAMVLVVTVTGYSYQAVQRQGDVRTRS